MNEYPIARMFRDSRVSRIYGGTSEIMKMLIARSLCGGTSALPRRLAGIDIDDYHTLVYV